MSATLIQIAEAVLSTLSGATLDTPIDTLARHAAPANRLEKQGESITGWVVPGGWTLELLDREEDSHDFLVDVVLQKKLSSAANDQTDPCILLVEQVADLFRHKSLATFPSAVCLRAAVEPLLPSHIRDWLQFTGVVSLNFQMSR